MELNLGEWGYMPRQSHQQEVKTTINRRPIIQKAGRVERCFFFLFFSNQWHPDD